jgi:hypothetical protein
MGTAPATVDLAVSANTARVREGVVARSPLAVARSLVEVASWITSRPASDATTVLTADTDRGGAARFATYGPGCAMFRTARSAWCIA